MDAAPFSSPNHFVHYSRRLAEELNESQPNGAIWANQFDNVANRQAHIETTGPEIWRQTDGTVDGFICAVGSGGTLAAISLARSSGSGELDQAALRVIRRAAPFPAPPPSARRNFTIRIQGG